MWKVSDHFSAAMHLSMTGELAQVVERSLSMWEVPGSIPGFSSIFLEYFVLYIPLGSGHLIIADIYGAGAEDYTQSNLFSGIP